MPLASKTSVKLFCMFHPAPALSSFQTRYSQARRRCLTRDMAKPRTSREESHNTSQTPRPHSVCPTTCMMWSYTLLTITVYTRLLGRQPHWRILLQRLPLQLCTWWSHLLWWRWPLWLFRETGKWFELLPSGYGSLSGKQTHVWSRTLCNWSVWVCFCIQYWMIIFTKLSNLDLIMDEFREDKLPGVNIYPLHERIHSFHGNAIWWLPLSSTLDIDKFVCDSPQTHCSPTAISVYIGKDFKCWPCFLHWG